MDTKRLKKQFCGYSISQQLSFPGKDKEIVGYLLHHNQKMFQTEHDGGYAAPLISRGIIRPSGRPGQAVDLTRMPFEVPDHIWSVLESNREKFPHDPPSGQEVETHPWAIHFMAR